MSTPSRFARWRIPILNSRLGYTEPQEPDPDPEDPTDYASQEEGGAVQVGIDVGTPGKVQEQFGHTNNVTATITVVFDDPPEVGNTLIAVLAVRGTTAATMLSTGWTLHPVTYVNSAPSDGGRMYFWYKTAQPGESDTVQVHATDTKDLYIVEWSGLGAPDDSAGLYEESATTSMVTGSVTPVAASGVLFAGFLQASRNGDLALGGGYTEDFDVNVDASGPSADFGHLIVDPFTGSYSASATSDQSDTYGSFLISFATASGGVAWFPGPAANDGDTGTSSFSDSAGPCLRVALAVERVIFRIELDVGQETAGATVYEFYGTDDPTFASTTLLGTLSFTATGSFTLDTVSTSWVPTASYQYYQLEHVSGGGSEREFYEIRLFSAVGGAGVTDHPALTGRDDPDQHPADAVSYDNTTSGLTADDVQEAIDEIVAESIFPVAGIQKILVKRTSDFTTTASNDSVPDYDTVVEDTMSDSWWDAGDPDGFLVTADYDGLDAVFTAKAAWSDPGSSTYVEGKMYYFPAASGRNRPIHSSTDEQYLLGVIQAPAVDNINHFVEFVSDPITVGTGDRIFMAWRTSTSQTAIDYDGRTAITLGAYVVGAVAPGGGSDLTIEDDGTPLATAATTLDFVGAGVTASGTGATKTITISGSSGGGVPNEILLESGHAVPFTFDDILQASDGSDFLWASE